MKHAGVRAMEAAIRARMDVFALTRKPRPDRQVLALSSFVTIDDLIGQSGVAP